MINCRMPNTDNDSSAPNSANALPPPRNLVEAIVAMLTGRDEQTELLRQLVHQGAAPRHGNHNPHQLLVPGYPEFLGTLWQNRLNYPGSSAQAITIKATLA